MLTFIPVGLIKLGEEFELSPVVNMIEELMQTVEFVTDKEAAQIKKNVNRSIREGYALTNDDLSWAMNHSCVSTG